MTKRLLDLTPRELLALRGRELLESIRLTEGRAVIAEIDAMSPALVAGITNAELAAAMGADIILMNRYDLDARQVSDAAATLREVQQSAGRPVGCILEPVDQATPEVSSGRSATVGNARKALDLGAQILVISGNPRTGVTHAGVVKAAVEIARSVGNDLVILAGKMHAAGVAEPPPADADFRAMAQAGVHGIISPAPGTVPGVTVETAARMVAAAHASGLLAVSAIGTSQEGSSQGSIEQIALWSKMTGADAHHIGDAGYRGIAVPENIMAFSIVLRGRRHTWFRMATTRR